MAVSLNGKSLRFEFTETHEDALLDIDFHRTLRIPDDGRNYPLPPSLGRFPLKAVDDLNSETVPSQWLTRGGVAFPMWQSEALWISFRALANYPFAVKIACGKINAITGENWSPELDHSNQDYVVIPKQPWIDGFCVAPGTIRQFVAMPLGRGYTAEEQITGQAEHGGLQVIVYPLKAEVYERLEAKRQERSGKMYSCSKADMGVAPGGNMRQKIYTSKYNATDWADVSSKCFVSLTNSEVWEQVSGNAPPTIPPFAADYNKFGLPWFEYYDDGQYLDSGEALKKLQSVNEKQLQLEQTALPENEGFDVQLDLPVFLRRTSY